MSEVPQAPTTPLSPLQNLGRFIVPPDMRALFNGLKTEMLAAFNCHQIGVVQSYDPGAVTVSALLVLQRAVYNNPPVGSSAIPTQPTVVPYPLLVDVPVFMLTGGGAYITMPIKAGDTCLVLFNDRDLDPWFSNGTFPAPANSSRMHSLADGLALVGFRPAVSTNPYTNVPTDGQHIGMGNASGTLRAALDALTAALIAATISGSTFSGTTITAITAAQTKIDAILQ